MFFLSAPSFSATHLFDLHRLFDRWAEKENVLDTFSMCDNTYCQKTLAFRKWVMIFPSFSSFPSSIFIISTSQPLKNAYNSPNSHLNIFDILKKITIFFLANQKTSSKRNKSTKQVSQKIKTLVACWWNSNFLCKYSKNICIDKFLPSHTDSNNSVTKWEKNDNL